ncbi:beta-1,3-glucosyltransferase-like [Actinia tenebrosa]|uniref:Beta-1,3-glucosyltransferase-like n=1 Tax=Actinia tenebrosa TaxID=6105 RepID=A0A6P8HXN7_ACTTE|nr:beta-1,3-glucosyltransferase-like [Actinia tenebrosa]
MAKEFLALIALFLQWQISFESQEYEADDPRNAFEFGALTKSDAENSTSQSSLGIEDIVMIVRTQSNSFHKKKAKIFLNHIKDQLKPEDKEKLVVKMVHQNWAPFGAWTIFPMLTKLNEEFSESKSWIFFCEEDTIIDLPALLKVLQRFNKSQPLFLGHGIQDHYPAIIHHFAFAENPSKFSFPDFSAGWAISSSLLKMLSSRLEKNPMKSDFTIDVQHEVAMYIWNDGKGISLTDVPEFCTSKPGEDKLCATSFNSTPFDCGEVSLDDIFFAVKTTQKFHKTRVPIVKDTLGLHAKHLVYYSETEDPDVPTENIGVPNTEMGHCAKLQAIIERSSKDKRFNKKPWLVVVDDDTIMSAPRMQRLLACYDPKEVILLGERYGYGVTTGFGYEYVTGGGGMVLSRAAINAIIESGCSCWEQNSPDDMWLGNCFRNIGVPIIHSPAFHQTRPIEYVPSLLAHQTPVSFHKHYENDPLAVYRDYLS